MKHYRWKLLGLTGLICLLASRAFPQDGCPPYNSFELVVLRAQTVAIGTVAGFETGPGDAFEPGRGHFKCENCYTTNIAIAITETLKGTHYDHLSIPLRHYYYSVGVVEQWKEHRNRLLFAVSPEGDLTGLYALDEPGLALTSLTLNLLRAPEQVIAAANDETLRSRGAVPSTVDTYDVAMPRKEVPQPGDSRVRFAKGDLLQERGCAPSGRVSVPVDERLEHTALELIRSDGFHDRIEGVHALKFFNKDAPVLIPLLMDPAWETEKSAEYNHGIEVRTYPVRQAAFDLLSKVWGMDVTPGALHEEVPQYETIENIFLRQSVTDEQLTMLIDCCRKLKSLDIVLLRPLTDTQFALIGKITTLTKLLIEGPSTTDAALTQLAGLKNLEELDLPGAGITDNGLRELAALPNLNSLNLRRTRITDDALQKLGAMPNLNSLDLTGTRVTKQGVAEMRLRHRDLNIAGP